jgi:methionine synthase I (cobalamin-dependent)
MRALAEAIGRRLLLADAPIEERLREVPVDAARDLFGAVGCLSVLSLTRARLMREIHETQLRGGADLLRTNTSAASPLELRRFGLADDAFAINYGAARLAAAAIDAVPGEGRRRFALGIVQDLGWEARPREIEAAAAIQAAGLIAGGVDGVAVESAGDPTRAIAFLRGAARAREEAHSAAGVFLLAAGAPATEAGRRIRFRELSAEEAEATPGLLRGFDVIGGRRQEDTPALDRLLRELADEDFRPAPERTPSDRLTNREGVVLYPALWPDRRARR